MKKIICQILLVIVLLSCVKSNGLDDIMKENIKSNNSIISLSKYAASIDADSLIYVPIGVSLCGDKTYAKYVNNCLECDLSNCFIWIKNNSLKAFQSYGKYGGMELILEFSNEKNKSEIQVFDKEGLNKLGFDFVKVNDQYFVTLSRLN